MNSMPSQTGRFNYDATTSTSCTSPSASSSPDRENSLGRRSSSTLNKALFEHNLSSILNNPHSPRSVDASWVGWWSSSTSVAAPEFAPINTSKPELEAERSDFQPYLSSISEQYHRFGDIRNHSNKEDVGVDNIGGQGEALVACLREVPALYFKEDFRLEEGATFRSACPFSNMSETLVLQERLSQYLDVVEMQLVKEISLRSNSFFDAQRQLEDLNVKVVEGCKRIRELKETIRLLDSDLVDSARDIQELNASRSNLLALQGKLRLILYVNQALSALKLLVTSADCAGALDIADDLLHLLDADELTGLHCFRHLRDHVATSIESINSILSAEFMRASMHDAQDLDATILSRAKDRTSVPTNGKCDEVKSNEEETSNFRDCILPLIIGLLRTAKLPSVLRMYRDTLTGDMKTAIKTTVAELLPVLVVCPQESDFAPGERTGDADGGGSSLASRLRSLSSESFVQLLSAIFKIVMAHLMRAAEVKRSIEWIMSNLDSHYAADSVSAAIVHGAVAAESAEESDAHLNSLLPYPAQQNAAKVSSLLGKSNEASSPSSLSRNFRADVLRENTEAVFAACDAAYGRWAKLLGVRALVHPRLRLQEFLSIYRITQEFINATEKIGGRLGYSIRGTLQSQVKSFLDFQHESRMTKIKALLDQETWVQVDVPDEFQTIVTSMLGSGILITENSDGDEGNLALNDGLSFDNSREVIRQHHMQQADAVPSSHIINSNSRDRTKSVSQTLSYRGVSYHMVNCGLILLKMLSEYVEMNNNLPALSSEVVHRVMEVLKFFNTRTCQLVLGAGAMQVSGLKSITSKHLALASQAISLIYVIIPEIRRVLFLEVPETRRALLLLEIDRVAQDYKVHRDEIHSKLVQIMRERLLVHLRTLPRIIEDWTKPEDKDVQPSQFAKGLMREVNFLHKVLSRTLHETDVQGIFRQVVLILHTQLSEAFSQLEISTPQANNRLRQDVLHILGCIRLLPSDLPSYNDTPNWGQLDEFFTQRFDDKVVQ